MAGRESYLIGQWVIEPSLNQVCREGLIRHLEPRAMDVLVHLMKQPSQVVSSEELLTHYWTAHTAEPRKIAKRINQIRKALDDDARRPTYIETIPKRGYRVVAPVSLRAATPPARLASARNGERIRVAVLPFASLSRDASQEPVSDGITAELIVSLGQRNGLDVPGRLAVMPYRDSHAPLVEVASALGVEFVITGTVSIEQDRYCVTVELMSAQADSPVWASRFEGDSVLLLRREIAAAVASIQWLRPGPGGAAGHHEPPVIVARDRVDEIYQDAVSFMGTQDFFRDWLPQALQHLEHVVCLQPDHADAWSYLALLGAMQRVRCGDASFTRCSEDALKALAIDPGLALPHVALGYIALLGDWDIARARREFNTALERSPANPSVLHGYHLMLRVDQNHDRAWEVAKMLRRAAPCDLRFRAEIVKAHYESRLYVEAVLAAETVRSAIPGYVDFSEAAALHRLGRFTDSFRARLAAYRLMGKAGATRAVVLEAGMKTGGYTGALQALSDYQFGQDTGTHGITSREFLFLPGRSGRLIDRLRHDIERRRPAMIGLVYNPEYDPLRAHPDFPALLGRITSEQLADSPSKRADVYRIDVFRGKADTAVAGLQRVIDEYPDDRRRPCWLETMAWAAFAIGDYPGSLRCCDDILDVGVSAHARVFAQLIKCASLVELARLASAQTALRAACEAWPDRLDTARDIEPLFFGGDLAMRNRFVSALSRVSGSIAPP